MEIEVHVAKIDTMLKRAKKGKNETVSKTEKGLLALQNSPNWRLNGFRGTIWNPQPLGNNFKPQLGTQTWQRWPNFLT